MRCDKRSNFSRIMQALYALNKQRGRGVGLTDIAEETGLTRKTIHNHMRDAVNYGFVTVYEYPYRPGLAARRFHVTEEYSAMRGDGT